MRKERAQKKKREVAGSEQKTDSPAVTTIASTTDKAQTIFTALSHFVLEYDIDVSSRQHFAVTVVR